MSFKSISKSDGLLIVKNLIKKFDSNYKEYTKNNSRYNESQTRSDFIDPFFEALNWDLHNKKNLPNYAREVILEDSVEGESTHQNPDYGFQAGTEKKFFVEAKKPSVNIHNNKSTSFQARSYGWTDKHKITVLTNFEHLIIYDTTVKPNNSDESKICRKKVYHYKDYASKFNEIHSLLSRDAIFSGQFDKKVGTLVTTKPTISPDEFFLEQINKWRKKLAKNLISNDPTLTEIQTNDIIQQFINRLIFLRICEDRTLENHQTLLNTAKQKDYKKFLSMLKLAEKKYDSDLFESSGTSLPIKIDTKNPEVLEIVEELYYPKSPFSFRIIESSILGDVYEMFLTEKITLKKKSGKPVKIELTKKPEDKDKDIIHTPSFIIRKILEESLNVKSQIKTPKELLKLKILDPACGSGSFLVEVLQYLINYAIEWYIRHDKSKVYQVKGGWRLKLPEKIKLLQCIRGVDVDYNAVEVTKFAICVKLLEGETKTTISSMTKILPKLNAKILCGNSLVDDSILNYVKKYKLSNKVINEINPFDWKTEFSGLWKNKFDVIIGNPPYMKTEDMKKYIPHQLQFFKDSTQYSTASGQFDKYYIFIQRGLQLLAKNGKLGFIVPHKFMKIKAGTKLRELLSKNNYVEKIIDFGTQQIFEKKTTYTCLLFLRSDK